LGPQRMRSTAHKPRRRGFDLLDSKTPWKTTGLAKGLASSSCERLTYLDRAYDIKFTQFLYLRAICQGMGTVTILVITEGSHIGVVLIVLLLLSFLL
jgi:hypothetical protein